MCMCMCVCSSAWLPLPLLLMGCSALLPGAAGLLAEGANNPAVGSGKESSTMKTTFDTPTTPFNAFATLTYGDGAYSCAAAVLGVLLRSLQPLVPRVIITSNVSEATLDILEAGGWHVVPAHDQSARGDLAMRSGKISLWALPFDRVMYFDTDHVPMLWETEAQKRERIGHLNALWSLSAAQRAGDRRAQLVAFEESKTLPCFNGGFFVLRPDLELFAQMAHQARQRSNWESRDAAIARCHLSDAAMVDTDQPFLNHVFQNWTSCRQAPWTVRHFYACVLLRPSPPYHKPERLWSQLDSFHFYEDTRPWDVRPHCGGQPEKHGYKVCVPTMDQGNGTTVRHSDDDCCAPSLINRSSAHSSIRSPDRARLVARCSTILTPIFYQWWTAFNELPQATRRACMARFRTRSIRHVDR